VSLNKKDTIKLIGCLLLVAVITLGGMILPCFVSSSVWGVIIGTLISYVLIVLLVIFCIPVWFRDFIERYWKEHGGPDENQSK
jgi:membrane protein YdbS with pleckstrin-like domain